MFALVTCQPATTYQPSLWCPGAHTRAPKLPHWCLFPLHLKMAPGQLWASLSFHPDVKNARWNSYSNIINVLNIHNVLPPQRRVQVSHSMIFQKIGGTWSNKRHLTTAPAKKSSRLKLHGCLACWNPWVARARWTNRHLRVAAMEKASKKTSGEVVVSLRSGMLWISIRSQIYWNRNILYSRYE